MALYIIVHDISYLNGRKHTPCGWIGKGLPSTRRKRRSPCPFCRPQMCRTPDSSPSVHSPLYAELGGIVCCRHLTLQQTNSLQKSHTHFVTSCAKTLGDIIPLAETPQPSACVHRAVNTSSSWPRTQVIMNSVLELRYAGQSFLPSFFPVPRSCENGKAEGENKCLHFAPCPVSSPPCCSCTSQHSRGAGVATWRSPACPVPRDDEQEVLFRRKSHRRQGGSGDLAPRQGAHFPVRVLRKIHPPACHSLSPDMVKS